MYIPYFSLPDFELWLQSTEFEVRNFDYVGQPTDIVTGGMALFLLGFPKRTGNPVFWVPEFSNNDSTL
jgi:hypothetical protein